MILDSEFASGDELLRFQNEAKVVATLDHPNIVPIHEVGEFEGQHCFSMKLIARRQPGRAPGWLRRRSGGRRGGRDRGGRGGAPRPPAGHPAPRPQAGQHPVDEQGRPHVTDFGLAKRIGDDSELTRTGSVAGDAVLHGARAGPGQEPGAPPPRPTSTAWGRSSTPCWPAARRSSATRPSRRSNSSATALPTLPRGTTRACRATSRSSA